jgi:hypothetical protein
MSRLIGYSTGALAKSDVQLAVLWLRERGVAAVELSALRDAELVPLLESWRGLDLSFVSYLSLHGPSQLWIHKEAEVASLLRELVPRRLPIVMHPDTLQDIEVWQEFGEWLCIENMDKRKPTGRTAEELDTIFRRFPDASLCFDIGHARQIDPTMGQATRILRMFGGRLKQVHMSEVNSRSGHDSMSLTAILAFRKVAHLIPPQIPIILESPVSESDLQTEIKLARLALVRP